MQNPQAYSSFIIVPKTPKLHPQPDPLVDIPLLELPPAMLDIEDSIEITEKNCFEKNSTECVLKETKTFSKKKK